MKILVVEDDELVAQTLSAILSMYRYAVEVAYDGQSALEILQAFEFDLVILDIFLPKLDGLEVCRQFRAQGKTTPILFLTAKDSSQDKAKGLDAGADDYLVKPFNPEELLARVRALLRRGMPTSGTLLQAGDLTLDPVSCEVRYQQELIPLTPKEFALMELFLRHPQRVYSCGMILEHLWTHEDTPGEEAVRTHIKGLRQKLKAAGAKSDLVTTVYGIGYRLKPQQETGKSPLNPSLSQTSPGQSLQPDQDPTVELRSQIDSIWQDHQHLLLEKVNLIETAIEQAAAQNLSPQSQDIAIRNAHSLAGSLGTFGLAEGSKLARSIEMSLIADTDSHESDYQQLRKWVQTLKQDVESYIDAKEPQSPSETIQESVLTLVENPELSQTLHEAIATLDLMPQSAQSLRQAITLAVELEPRAIILCPSPQISIADIRDFSDEIRELAPSTALIGCLSGEDTTNRLALEKLNFEYILATPCTSEMVTHAIEALGQQRHDWNATILAVDDDISILAILKVLLKPWGVKVHTVNSPETFWDQLEAVQPDLVILDVEMPGQSGIELCHGIRNNSFWSELPVLFLTVHGNDHIIHQIFQAGADDYIQKPFVGPELVTRILNRLDRARLVKRLVNIPASSSEKVTLTHNFEPTLNLNSESIINTLNIADDGILFLDQKQQIIFFNLGAENLFGYEASEILGKPLDMLLPKRYLKKHRRHVKEFGQAQVKAKQMAERQEIFGLKKDGTEFPAEASIAVLQEENQQFFAVILRDVTQRKLDERRKDEFISMVSHELRTPLTSIHGSLQMLSLNSQELSTNLKQRHWLDIAVNSTERLVRLVNNLLSVERIKTGKVQMCFIRQNLAKIAQTAIDEMQPMAEEFGVSLQVTTTSTKLPVDRDYILQLLSNLLSNAIRYSPRGETVSLVLQKLDDWAQISVVDQGRGIPTEKLKVIFERFEQVDANDSRDRQGTGLGLAICKSIVELHQGKIWVESEYGKGSQFFVSLPLHGEETP